LIFFGRNVTDRVSNQKAYYCATSNNLCFCTTWQNGETQKSHFHSNAVSVHCLNSTSCLIFFNLFDSRLTPTMQYDILNHVINAFSPQGCSGAWFRRKKVESAAGVGLCCMHNAAVHCLLGFLFRKVMQKH